MSERMSIYQLVAAANAQNARERRQVPAPLHPCRFEFDAGPVWNGFTDDTTWNGWANVWVTVPELMRLVAMWEEAQPGEHCTADDLDEFPREEHGELGVLVSLNGYCAMLVTNPEGQDAPAEPDVS